MQEFELIFEEKGIEKAAKQFLRLAEGRKHFAFHGKMGAGKTTFIKSLCNLLDSEDLVSSPTFSIINEYNSKQGGIIYHFDFYRIKSAEELLDIGFNEYCEEEAYCFVEWPEKGEEVLPEDFMDVFIEEINGNKRILRFSKAVTAN